MPPDPQRDLVRAFVAVEVSQAVVEQAAQMIERLRLAGGNVKWVEPHNLHLTLKFLGPTARPDLPRLTNVLGEVAAAQPPFELEFAGVGAFPSLQRPDVIWLAVSTGKEALAGLAAAAEAACEPLGWERETRPYRAHLTLGRSRDRHGGRRASARSGPGGSPAPTADRAALTRALAALSEAAAGRAPVERIVLIQSDLRPSGPIYTVLESFPLAGTMR